MLGLRTLIYKVPNLAEAKAWYAKAFETEPYFDEAFYVGFNIGGYELGLMPVKDNSLKSNDLQVGYWGVTDIKATYARLLELGAVEFEAPYNVGGELMTATLTDPWGNVLGLIYNPYFKADEK